jgi:hypothetical protein
MKEKKILTILFTTLLLDVIGILIPVIPALFTDSESANFMLAGYSVGAQYFIAGLMTALFGVMQFLAADGIEVSDYGSYDTSSLNKEVMVTVRASFSLE